MKKIPGKTLVIVGNGFDLAHGLKTSYNDFFKDYILRKISEAGNNTLNQNTEDLLFRVTYNKPIEHVSKDIRDIKNNSLYEIITDLNSKDYFIKVIPLTSLARRLFKNFNKWVDIESSYYLELRKIIGRFYNAESLAHIEIHQEALQKEIRLLNNQMSFLSRELEDYLSIKCNVTSRLSGFNYEFVLKHYWEYNEKLQPWNMGGENHEIYFLDFNYTNTISLYERSPYDNIKITTNKIHGQLKSTTNPIIFGFGDERDAEYHKIENVHLDEAFEKIKSFSYFKTDNYNKLLDFIDSESFTVVVLGHSCGLSDRVLLSTIFEHDNCEKIRICYYESENKENDYTSKTYQISRHFEDKVLMRKRILPIDQFGDGKIPQKNK